MGTVWYTPQPNDVMVELEKCVCPGNLFPEHGMVDPRLLPYIQESEYRDTMRKANQLHKASVNYWFAAVPGVLGVLLSLVTVTRQVEMPEMSRHLGTIILIASVGVYWWMVSREKYKEAFEPWVAKGIAVQFRIAPCKKGKHERPKIIITLPINPAVGMQVQQSTQMQQMQVVVPTGCEPGSVFEVQAPGGAMHQVTVPPGQMPGSTMLVNFPAQQPVVMGVPVQVQAATVPPLPLSAPVAPVPAFNDPPATAPGYSGAAPGYPKA